jgi:transmembrane sensor
VVSPSARLEVLRPRTERLPDGTVVELRDAAEIRVDYAGTLRRVALLRGEAFFEVAHDAARPFVVTAAGVDVRAVGTAFAVRHEAKDIAVLVTEGRVRVSKQDAPVAAPSAADTAVVLGTGQQVVVSAERFDAAMIPLAVAADERDVALAWRVPRLELRGTPLAEVIAAFNGQPGAPRLRLAEPGLGPLPLSGVLRADNVGVLYRLLETSYHLEAVDLGTETVIRRKR